uniref:Uncharacterized protein n=1 Tax=Phlebotomus papatasi TaxID=29031 RepID=A0A1B0DG04_PHLPP
INHTEAVKRLKISTTQEYLKLQEELLQIEDANEDMVKIIELKKKFEDVINRDREGELLMIENVELIPILEYFAVKVLLDDEDDRIINKSFFLTSKYSSPNEMKMILIKNDQFRQDLEDFKKMTSGGRLTEISESYQSFATDLRSLDKMKKMKIMDLLHTKYENIGNAEKYDAKHENIQRNGPILTQALSSALLNPDGTLKEAGFNTLEAFKGNLKKISQILWSNMENMSRYNLELIDYRSAVD